MSFHREALGFLPACPEAFKNKYKSQSLSSRTLQFGRKLRFVMKSLKGNVQNRMELNAYLFGSQSNKASS